jgi:cytidylate kinase
MTVITLSRQMGSHGEEIATQLAQTLGLRLIDAQTINQAAQRAGVPQMALAELEHEKERGLANRVLKALRTMPSLSPLGEAGVARPDLSGLTIPFAGLFSPTVPPISASLEGYVLMVGLVIRGLAREGNVLILGRGGQVLLRKHPAALHVQIVAPLAYRIQVVMAREGSDQRAAQNRVRASDRARFDYVRRYHDADWLDPTLYHLVINTGHVPVDTAAELIMVAQRATMEAFDRENVDE